VILAQHCDACAERATRWAAEGAPVRPRISIVLVDSDVPKCQRPGCENVLSGRQAKFCSKTCGGTVRQARFRERDLIQFSATDVDLISQTLEAPKEFRREVRRAWKNSLRPIYLGEGVWADPEVLGCWREAARR
jgi:hypothetical protein